MDYKILAKALDNRLKKVLPKVISEYQSGFMEGRNILHNLIKLLLIMEYANRKRLMVVIMAIDFKKCFDTIDHTAIVGSLKYFNVGTTFIKWTMLLFTDFELCAQNNGFITDWFKPSCGVHQGCNITPHLFNCTGQVFADLFEKGSVEGIEINSALQLLSQFADDTTLFLKATGRNLESVTDTLAIAEKNLGLKVNYDKTSIYCIGSLRDTDAKLYMQKNVL